MVGLEEVLGNMMLAGLAPARCDLFVFAWLDKGTSEPQGPSMPQPWLKAVSSGLCFRQDHQHLNCLRSIQNADFETSPQTPLSHTLQGICILNT